MEKLKLNDEFKIAKEEVLLDPEAEVTKCGFEVSPLLLNDLYYMKEDGTYIKATDFILQEKIEIEYGEPPMIIEGQTVTLKWKGTNDVRIYIDGSDIGILPSGNKEHTQAYTEGHHTVLVQCIRDRRGLTYEFDVEATNTVTIEYEGDE
jgi:hypothetical protein